MCDIILFLVLAIYKNNLFFNDLMVDFKDREGGETSSIAVLSMIIDDRFRRLQFSHLCILMLGLFRE